MYSVNVYIPESVKWRTVPLNQAPSAEIFYEDSLQIFLDLMVSFYSSQVYDKHTLYVV